MTRRGTRRSGPAGAQGSSSGHGPWPQAYHLVPGDEGLSQGALGRKLLANRRYECVKRRPGQILQDFFAAENMAYADAVKEGMRIDTTGERIKCSPRVA